jgi:hypothetical protein
LRRLNAAVEAELFMLIVSDISVSESCRVRPAFDPHAWSTGYLSIDKKLRSLRLNLLMLEDGPHLRRANRTQGGSDSYPDPNFGLCAGSDAYTGCETESLCNQVIPLYSVLSVFVVNVAL